MSHVQVSLGRAFDRLYALLGSPSVFVIPTQTPSGAYADDNFDAWRSDADDSVVTKTPTELTSTEVPALWGADAEGFVLQMGGAVPSGDLVAMAKATYRATFDGAMEVVTGSLTGERYTVSGIEDAPDGTDVFIVVSLKQRYA